MKFFLDSGTLIHGQNLTYSIKKVLGHGSFGITYLATTKMKGPLGEVSVQVALKEFFAKDFNERKEDGSVREHSPNSIVSRYGKDFQKEAQNLSRLKNPGIVNVLEAFEANGTYYYSMEYIEGETLDEYIIKKGCLPEMEAIEAIRSIAASVNAMHSQKMLHLDLKPKNVMRRDDGELLLIDFGLSKQYEENGEPESSTCIGLGTPGYAPIEQSQQSHSREFSPTLDIYALGATFYKMLTGQTPPTSSSIFNDGFPEDALRARNISQNTIDVCRKAMAPGKKDRPQSVKEFVCSFKCDEYPKNLEDTTYYSENVDKRYSSVKNTAVGSKCFSSFRKRFYFYLAMLGLIVISSFFGVFIFTHLEPKHLRISSEILGYISGVIILVLGILLLDKYYLKIRKSKFRKCLELLLVILLIAAIVVYVRDFRLMFSI